MTGKVDPGAAKARFEEMEARRQKNSKPVAPAAPMVTEADVEGAGLSTTDASTGLELPSPLELFLRVGEWVMPISSSCNKFDVLLVTCFCYYDVPDAHTNIFCLNSPALHTLLRSMMRTVLEA